MHIRVGGLWCLLDVAFSGDLARQGMGLSIGGCSMHHITRLFSSAGNQGSIYLFFTRSFAKVDGFWEP